MHRVRKAFPCAFDGIHSEDLAVDEERDFGTMAEGLKKAGLIGDLHAPASGGETALRDDGPTIAEYMAAGYSAAGYPPQGYAPRSTPEEIEAAIRAQAEERNADDAAKAVEALRSELSKLTAAQLRDKAVEAKLEIPDDAKKGDLIDALIAAASATQV